MTAHATDWLGISTLVTAVGTVLIGVIVALRQTDTTRTVREIHHEVKTINAQTIAQLADAVETRRIGEIPEEDRTALERGHLHDTNDV